MPVTEETGEECKRPLNYHEMQRAVADQAGLQGVDFMGMLRGPNDRNLTPEELSEMKFSDQEVSEVAGAVDDLAQMSAEFAYGKGNVVRHR